MKTIRLLIFLLPLIFACNNPQVKNQDVARDKYNVLMIVLDACRADHLGCYAPMPSDAERPESAPMLTNSAETALANGASRTKHLDAGHRGGYKLPTSPNIDKFASESILFEQAYSQGIQTLPSFGSFLTGRYPMTLNLYWTNPPHRILHPEELTLAEVLRIHNYQTTAFPTGPHLWPLFGLNQGFQIYTNNPDFNLSSGEGVDFLHQRKRMLKNAFSNPEGKREVWSFQDTLPLITDYLKLPHNKPFFLMAHSNDTHPPYDNPIEFGHKFDPDYQGIFCPEPTRPFPKESRRDGTGGFRVTLNTLNNITGHKLSLKGLAYNWDYVRDQPYPRDTKEEVMLSDQDLNHIRAHYDGAIAYADESVGKILKQLADSGLAKNTMVILIADHGETLGERGLFDRSFGKPLPLYNEVTHVPLIIRLPGLKTPKRISQPMQLIDLMPTILDLLGIKTPDNLDGVSLKSVITGNKYPDLERPIITEALPDEMAFRDGEWKLIHRPAGLSELYNLKDDPAEKTNLIASPEAQLIYKEMLDKVRRWQTEQLSKRGVWAKELNENLWEKIYKLQPR